jgi:predicted transcriptional regulator
MADTAGAFVASAQRTVIGSSNRTNSRTRPREYSRPLDRAARWRPSRTRGFPAVLDTTRPETSFTPFREHAAASALLADGLSGHRTTTGHDPPSPATCRATTLFDGEAEVLTRCTLLHRTAVFPPASRATFKTSKDKLTNAMIDRLEKEVDMLERHLQVLKMVIDNEPIGIVKMSNETGYPHHKVRYSLRVLEEENLIEPSSQGAITTERTEEFVDELDEKLNDIVQKLQSMKIEDAAEIES